jgi:hypothetical protein
MPKCYHYESEKFHWDKAMPAEILTENQSNKTLNCLLLGSCNNLATLTMTHSYIIYRCFFNQEIFIQQDANMMSMKTEAIVVHFNVLSNTYIRLEGMNYTTKMLSMFSLSAKPCLVCTVRKNNLGSQYQT